ncbi:hypothetical protein ABI59_19190 [Acidobacteria bacterium Mor1]|nr:hypothetical protein ABI59_19190 [Acidobacteria bacterium Mor1]
MRTCLAILVFLTLTLSPAQAEWWLWEAPTDDDANIGPTQTSVTQYGVSQNGKGIGQSFKPTSNTIYRIDLKLKNRHDRRPFTIKLWAWDDSAGTTPGCTEDSEYASTVAQTPLWTDTVIVPGPDQNEQIRSFFPRDGSGGPLQVVAGQPYYLELGHGQGDAEWAVHQAWSSTDPYPDGMLWTKWFRYDEACITGATLPNEYADLYFRIYSAPGTNPPALTCADGSAAPCFSATGTWTDPDVPGDPITKNDYRWFIDQKATQSAGVLAGDGKNGAQQAFFDAFLYEMDSDVADANRAVALFHKGYDWRSNHLQESVGFTWLERPGWAYHWLQSHALSSENEALIESLLLHSGLRFWDKRELGSHNRALGGALGYRLLTSLVDRADFNALSTCSVTLPAGKSCLFQSGEALGVSDYDDWKAYADQVWADFKADWDFTEDSGHYHTLSWRYVLEFDKLAVELDSATSVWENSDFRALVARFFDLHTPLGPFPAHGDGNGWNLDFASPALLFETAAAKLKSLQLGGEEQYRWLAFRLMDYHRTHALTEDDDPQYDKLWEIVYNEYPAFAFAYLITDENIAKAEPGPQGEVLGANQVLNSSYGRAVSSTGVGQTFEPVSSPLVRIDLNVQNLGPESAGTIRLWKWDAAGYAATVAQTPLYEDSVDLSGLNVIAERSFFPFLDVAEGETYYFELQRSTQFEVRGDNNLATDYYPDGSVWEAGVQLSGVDLWFRTYTLSRDGSVVTERLEADARRSSQMGSPKQPEVFGTSKVPDKLILRSGYGPNDLHAVVNLITDYYGHGQLEAGGVLFLSNDGSLLISGSSYDDKQDKDQTRSIVRRYWGGTARTPSDRATVDLDDYRLASVASIKWEDQRGWDIDLERRIFFVKNRFLLVRDGHSFASAAEVSAGNIWHAYDVRSEHGTNWYSIYNRVPACLNGFEYKNPEEYLLLSMVDRGYAVDEWEEDYSSGNPPTAPFIIGQRWSGNAAAGSERWFDTVLLPHGDTLTPTQAAADISVTYDDGVNVAMQVEVGGETWTVVDNPQGISINTASLETDATYLIARTSASEDPYLLAREATVAYVNHGPGAVIDATWTVSTTVELQTDPEDCPTTSTCSGVTCVPGATTSDVDTYRNSCRTSGGGLILCGAGKTLHHKTRDCDPAACCSTSPGCFCLGQCSPSSMQELVCEN